MEYDGLGARCALESCRTLDYLPFRCSLCNLEFCQHHQQPGDHACSAAAAKTVPTCPLCHTAVPVPRGSTRDMAVSRHIDAGCPKRHRANPVCALSTCSVRDPAATRCDACGLVFCLKHCLEPNHNCTSTRAKAPVAASNRSRFPGSLSALRRTLPTAPKPHSSNTRKSPSAPQSPPKPKPLSPPASPATASNAKRKYRLDFANKPTAPIGDSSIDAENRAPFAVVFPPSTNLQPRYMFFSYKHSAGKIIDSIRKFVPQLPPAPSGSRYSLYAVKHDLSSVNLLPYVTPLRDLRNLVGPNDTLVLDTSSDGLDPTLISSFRSTTSSWSSSALPTSKKGSKCVVA